MAVISNVVAMPLSPIFTLRVYRWASGAVLVAKRVVVVADARWAVAQDDRVYRHALGELSKRYERHRVFGNPRAASLALSEGDVEALHRLGVFKGTDVDVKALRAQAEYQRVYQQQHKWLTDELERLREKGCPGLPSAEVAEQWIQEQARQQAQERLDRVLERRRELVASMADGSERDEDGDDHDD